jgi:glutathione S-transferase
VYLAERNGWSELYPEEAQQRAKIHQYLHWHHSNARLATTQVVRPLAMQMWGKATPETLKKTDPKQVEKTLTSTVERVETFLSMPYIAQTQQPTIADFACYCELDQIEAMGLFDFSKYPKTADWMKRMKVR